MKSVVVTGMGMVSPLGTNPWTKLISDVSGIVSLNTPHSQQGPYNSNSKVAALVKHQHFTQLTKQNSRLYSPFVHYAMIACNEALLDSNWINLTQTQKDSTV
jgi:3-oxoacyl-(acyl-carrier-protein) synthase